ncbi:rod shape-determining protein MreC [Atopococcus tabaci]|uniref:rod shape-determining protein MreC n=1 Tax=Atopococcus tabaci TaxID=269774 RepID=UPI0004071EE8|nr:rod shape-determining protein MreC [Atopococcus tabaci]
MNKSFTNKKLIVLLISVILFFALLAVSLNRNGSVNIFQQIMNDVTAVAGRVVSKPANALTNVFESVNHLLDTYEENQRLKQEIDSVYEIQAELSVTKEQNEALKEELELQNSLTDYSTITGAVIARNPDSWVEEVIVDRGSQDGVELGMSVMSGQGLIGRISEVNPTSSKVRLISTMDQRNNLVSSEIITEEGDVVHGVISAYEAETGRLIMNQITTNVTLEPGQQVVTSGLSGKTPRSLLIGTVDEVTMDNFGLSQRVYVVPAGDFNDIRYVSIIDRHAESEE